MLTYGDILTLTKYNTRGGRTLEMPDRRTEDGD